MTNTNIDLSALDELTPEEREYALKILGDLQAKGSSEDYTNLLYSDYLEIPVDIETFITNDMYLGKAWKDPSSGKLKIYPYWIKKLKELFPDNLNTSKNNAIFSGARGLGKSEIAILCCLYIMYRVMCLKNPLAHFHLKPTEKICFAFMNITKTLAEDIGISKFQNTVQLSPWFMSKGQMTQKNNMPYWVPPDPINIIIGSQPSHVIGLPVLVAFFDEISFIRNQNIDKQKQIAIDMIDTAIGGMKTRFVFNGVSPALLILASSKRSEKSFLETHMKKKLESEPDNVMIVDEAVWVVKNVGTYSNKKFNVAIGNKFLNSQVIPDDANIEEWQEKGYKILEVPIDFRPNFLDDIDRALCDFAGISSSEITKYINGQMVYDIVNNDISNPFTKDIIEVGNDPSDKSQYYDFFDLSKIPANLKNKPLYIHMDMSVSGDKTGIAGTWIAGKKTSIDELNQSKDLFFRLAFCVSVKAPKGRQVSFEKNRNFIYWLKEQGFNIKGISTDSFQSVDTGQALLQKGYNYKQISVDRVDTNSHICMPYQYFRSTIYEKRIEMFKNKLLIDEITDLERNINTGRVDHPDSGSKDSADAVCGSVYFASQNAEQYAYDYGENLDTITQFNIGNNPIEDISNAFTNELQSMMFEETKEKIDKPMSKPQPQGPLIIDGIFVF